MLAHFVYTILCASSLCTWRPRATIFINWRSRFLWRMLKVTVLVALSGDDDNVADTREIRGTFILICDL